MTPLAESPILLALALAIPVVEYALHRRAVRRAVRKDRIARRLAR